MPRKTSSVRPKGSSAQQGASAPHPMRLQRLLAAAGFGSRRQCEELIEAGRVDIDGQVVTQLGTTVDPSLQKVRVDGVPLKKQKLVYYAVHKPAGFVTTNRDPQGRPRVIDLVPPDERVFPVGRLDRSSEGLILLTNDGELAQKLAHPKFGVRKVYRVTVAGKVDGETMKKMRQGIYIAEGFVKVEGVRLLRTRSRATELEIILREGKNREIRRILARLGHKVQQLRRIAVGPLRLGELPAGAYRMVTPQEVEKLWAATEEEPETLHATSRRKPRGAKRRVGTAKGGPGRRSAKKRHQPKPPPKGEFPLSFGESRTSGIIIGGDSEPEDKRSKKPGRGQKKRSTGSKRFKSARPSSGAKKGTGGGRKRKGSGKSIRPTMTGGKTRDGARKKKRKH